MKKAVPIIVLAAILCLSLISCDKLMPPKEDVVEVIDGYVVVNGVKTDIQAKGESSSQPDKKDDVIEVVDGYLVVNGVKTGYQVKTNDVIEIVDGYVVVNGVKTDIYVPSCNHSWTTVTTNPTCAAGGYDTLTCSLCGKSVKENETAALSHSFGSSYSFDSKSHWYQCANCNATKDKADHNLNDDGICSECGTPTTDTAGIVYDISSDGTYAEVLGYTGTASKVKIASEYNGFPVKSIYNNAFLGNKTITSVIIPDSVVTIYSSAFMSCSNLSSVVIGSNVENIGAFAFAGCGFSSIVIPENVKSIGEYAFSTCGRLVSVVLPDSVTYVDRYAFSDCSRLESVVLSKNMGNIPYGMFMKCFNLKTVIIPEGIITIDDQAFEGCPVTNVNFPSTLLSICGQSFTSSSEMTITEYEGIQYRGYKDNPYFLLVSVTNKNFSSYTIHEDTVMIANSAFSNCNRLSSIYIPDGVISIGDSAFYFCQNLKEIRIPESLVYINRYSLEGCPLQFNVYNGKYHYLGTDNNPYQILMIAGDTASLSCHDLHNDTVVIAGYAFDGCLHSSITIPDNVTHIGSYAFRGVTSIILGKNITCIGNYVLSASNISYKGNTEDWAKVTIGTRNEYFVNYNYQP